MSELIFEEATISGAWRAVVLAAAKAGRSELTPALVSITGFGADGNVQEDKLVRDRLDAHLKKSGKQSVETVANTIFPVNLWNRAAPRAQLFERYKRLLPRVRRASTKNRRGTYFERMVSGGPPGAENQLDFCIAQFTGRKGVRRSILQVAIFNPAIDHSAAALIGFPCLQHVTFTPTDGGLSVNAFYACQYLVERAYGNYLGLCRLGQFVAHELGVPLIRVTCLTGIAELDVSKSAAYGIAG